MSTAVEFSAAGAAVRRVPDRIRMRIQEGGEGESALAAQLEQSLACSLNWHAACLAEFQDQQFLFESYADSVNALEKAHADCLSFLTEACRTSLEFRSDGIVQPEARDTLIEAEMERLVAMVNLPGPAPDQTFNARLANEPLDRVREVLSAELTIRIASLVRGFLELCVNLVEKEVVGLVEWSGPGTCELFFWKRVLIQKLRGMTIQEGEKRVEAILGGTKIVTARTEQAAGEHEIRQARHEHHLLHAQTLPLDEVRFAIPREFAPLMRAIPSWMRPAMRLVTGVQFRGTIHEVEVSREAWEHARPLPAQEEYRMNVDPALVLGPLVITGWDGEAQSLENQRLDQEARSRQAAALEAQHARVIFRAILLFFSWQAAALVVTATGAVWGSSLLWAGGGMGVAGIAFLIGLARYDAVVRSSASAKESVFAVLATASGMATCQFLTIALFMQSVEHLFMGLFFAAATLIAVAEWKKICFSR